MKTSLRLEALAALLLAAAPAFAQKPPSDTLKVILAKGAVFAVDGQDYDFFAKPDGTYVDRTGAQMGSYRVDGKSLCITPAAYPREACLDFPDGKTSGDRFDLDDERGQATVTIR